MATPSGTVQLELRDEHHWTSRRHFLLVQPARMAGVSSLRRLRGSAPDRGVELRLLHPTLGARTLGSARRLHIPSQTLAGRRSLPSKGGPS